MYKSLQIISLILALTGTWLVAFGLRVKEGISTEMRNELKIEKTNLIVPSDVRQRIWLIILGLLSITIATILQAYVIICS